jgi:uncharacterized membrane protein YjjP (DUF1212 family)
VTGMEPEDRTKSTELALDVALIVMRSGGSTEMVDRAFRNVLDGFKVSGVSAAWRLDFVAVHGAADGPSATVLRPVGTIGVNLTRASEAVVLGERVARGEADAADLPPEIERVSAIASPYNRWAMTAAATCGAGAFCRLCGGDWGALGVAAVAAGVGQFLRPALQGAKLSAAHVTLICGVVSACLAGLGLRLGLGQAIPATLIASVIYMVPGIPLINGFVDLVSHRHLLVGLERIANAAYLFLVLTIAILFAFSIILAGAGGGQ